MENIPLTTFERQIQSALGMDLQPNGETVYSGRGYLKSCFRVSELATAALSAAARELAALIGGRLVTLDRTLTDRWFDRTLRPIGWSIPEA